MNKLIIIDPLHKRRGILKSLFFYFSKKNYYIDESFSYHFELKDLSKIDKKYFIKALEIIAKEEKDKIKKFSIENEEENLVMFCSITKKDFNKKVSEINNSEIAFTGICPSEYLVGKFFAEKNINRNVQINFFLDTILYVSVIHQGTLIWVEKVKGKESISVDLPNIVNKDIYDKEIIKVKDLKDIFAKNKKDKESVVEITFKNWMSSYI